MQMLMEADVLGGGGFVCLFISKWVALRLIKRKQLLCVCVPILKWYWKVTGKES